MGEREPLMPQLQPVPAVAAAAAAFMLSWPSCREGIRWGKVRAGTGMGKDRVRV